MHIKIYVPTQNDKISAYLEDLAKLSTKLFGGCTIIPNCVGFWINDKNHLIKDKIAIIEAYFDKNKHPPKIEGIKATVEFVALKIKEDLKQESVAYCIDNQIYFV